MAVDLTGLLSLKEVILAKAFFSTGKFLYFQAK